MHGPDVVIVGGGAAGCFAAIACAEVRPGARITLFEKGSKFLSKVLISGGGRCNVTRACYDPREFSAGYPRGGKALIGAFHRFQPRDTIAWFESRGVRLKTEGDGRVFPVSDSSRTIVNCLLEAADASGITRRARCGVEAAVRSPDGSFALTLSTGQTETCTHLLLAMGGCRTAEAGRLAASLGHTLEAPVPSLFSFRLRDSWLTGLAGISLESVMVSVPGTSLREQGALLVTHQGVSGPAVLRLSAWGARELHDRQYRFPLHMNWLPHLNRQGIQEKLEAVRAHQPARLVANTTIQPLPARLWERLVAAAGIPQEMRWAGLSRTLQQRLAESLTRTELQVTGKSLNKEEFVTCGGVRLNEVDFRTMESRLCPGLYFAGELLDIDGITGGFNFQAAWTTGWIAGRSLASR